MNEPQHDPAQETDASPYSRPPQRGSAPTSSETKTAIGAVARASARAATCGRRGGPEVAAEELPAVRGLRRRPAVARGERVDFG